jgi:hypothetical protein
LLNRRWGIAGRLHKSDRRGGHEREASVRQFPPHWPRSAKAVEPSGFGVETIIQGCEWRATVDEDGRYSFAVAPIVDTHKASFYTGNSSLEIFEMTIATIVVGRWRMDR